MKIEKFDKRNLNKVAARMDEVLKEMGFEGVSFRVNGGTFEDAKVTFKVEGRIKGARTRDQYFLDSIIEARGLVKEKNGRKLVDYKARNRKYPYIYEEAGKLYKCDDRRVTMLFSA